MRNLRSMATVAALLMTMAGLAQAQTAPASVNADVMSLHASTTGKKIDPKIGKLPQLKKPPFSQFPSWKLLAKTRLLLAKGAGQSYAVANGSTVTITYKDVVPPAKAGDPVRYAVTATVKKSDGSTPPATVVTALVGEAFFVSAGQYQTGVIMVAVKISP
jgi:hypothetical protein